MIFRRSLLSGQVLYASFLILSILLVSQGCATTTTPLPTMPWSPHLKEKARVHIHTIDVLVDETLPQVTFEGLSKGAFSGAGRKAGKWSANWGTVGLAFGAGGSYAGAVGAAILALTPVVAAIGAVGGAIEAPSAKSVESQEAQVREIVQVADLPQRMEEHVRMQVTDQTDISLAAPQGRTRAQVSPQDIATTTGVSPQRPLLTIRLQSLDLRGGFDADPPLALHFNAHVTLATPADATPLYNRTFQYVTRGRPLSEWVAEDAKMFHAALELSLARLAELIVDDIFLTYPFAHELVHWQH